jgi:hypothetical protein
VCFEIALVVLHFCRIAGAAVAAAGDIDPISRGGQVPQRPHVQFVIFVDYAIKFWGNVPNFGSVGGQI